MGKLQEANFMTMICKALGLRLEKEMDNPQDTFESLNRFKEVSSVLEDYEKNILKPTVFEMAEKHGVVDEKGSATLTFADGTGFKKEARVTVKVNNEKAVEIFENLNLENLIEKRAVVNESVDLMELKNFLSEELFNKFFSEQKVVPEYNIESAFYGGKLTDTKLQEIIDKKTIFAMKEIKPKKSK